MLDRLSRRIKIWSLYRDHRQIIRDLAAIERMRRQCNADYLFLMGRNRDLMLMIASYETRQLLQGRA